MDSRNLAIIFGPTLIRDREDNLASMVTDMSDQCQLIETLISFAEWLFGSEDESDVPDAPIPDPQQPVSVAVSHMVSLQTPGARKFVYSGSTPVRKNTSRRGRRSDVPTKQQHAKEEQEQQQVSEKENISNPVHAS